MAAYRLVQTDRFVLSALAGARYLYMKAEVDLDTRAPLPPMRRSVSDSGSNWDGIVGVHGHVNLSENWYLPYHLDVGTGESDLTWQVDAGIGYRFGRFDIVAGYRYLDYEFDDDTIFKNLDVRGPYVGIEFWF
jgi:hypothetical protein